MAKLRAYYLNGGDMLKLVRYQKKDKPEGEEEKEILSSAQIIHSEKNRHGEVGKYLESITHSVSDQVKKQHIQCPYPGIIKSIHLYKKSGDKSALK